MEETKNIWNKTTEELTVKDQLIIVAAVPIVMIGGMAVAGAAVTAGSKVASKVRSIKANRQLKKLDK